MFWWMVSSVTAIFITRIRGCRFVFMFFARPVVLDNVLREADWVAHHIGYHRPAPLQGRFTPQEGEPPGVRRSPGRDAGLPPRQSLCSPGRPPVHFSGYDQRP
jgi:hypothetical protein